MEWSLLLVFFLLREVTSQQCPNGYSALFNNNNQPVTCSSGNSCTCSQIKAGYFCHSSGYCCGVSAQQCPSSSAQLSSSGFGIQSCQSNNDCQSGYFCNQNACCALPSTSCGGTGGTGNCPSGQIMVNNQCVQLSAPGGQCSTTQQCLDNSACNTNFGSSGTCICQNNYQQLGGYCITPNNGQCSSNQVMVNGVCQQLATLNNNCVGDAQCVGGARCQMGTCQCASGTTSYCPPTNGGQQQCYCVSSSTSGSCPSNQVQINGQCYVQINSYGCSFSQPCAGNSQCSGNGQCLCPSGTYQSGNQCINNGGTGVCNSNQVMINGQCYVQINSYGCSFNQPCAGNSQCSNNGQCLCPSGTYQSGNQCISNGGSGGCPSNQVLVNGQCLVQAGASGCTFSVGCAGNAQCSNGMCLCPSGTMLQNNQCVNSGGNCGNNQVMIGNQCYYTIQAGYSGCTYTQQCLGNSICQNGQCQCPSGSSLVGTTCQSSGLSCPQGQAMVNGQCTQMVPPGNQCYSSTQCLDNSVCSFNNQCTCQSNTVSNSGYCVPSSNFCSGNSVLVNNNCMPLAMLGQSCSYDQQCVGGSNCISGQCSCNSYKTRFCIQQSNFQACYCLTSGTSSQCQNNQVYINGQCYNQVQLGYSCYYSQQCLGNSTCQSGQCLCPTGTTQSGSQCISSSSQMSLPGSYCTSFTQCLDNSICSSSTCTCQNGATALYGYCVPQKTDNCGQTMIMINNQCVNLAVYGSSCQTDRQCLGGTTCNNNQCSCRSGQPTCIQGNSGSQCYCNSGTSNGIPINSFGCNSFQPCAGNAQCSFNGQCLCPTGTVQQGSVCVSSGGCQNEQVLINGQCYNTFNPNGYGCQYPQQCLGNSQCYNGYCSCPTGTTLQNNQCMSSGGGVCRSYQVLVNNQCLDTVGIGMQCSNQAQCTVSNSICSGTCVCSNGLTYNGSGCIYSTISCSQGTVLMSNTCSNLVALNQQCFSSVQCLGYGICSSNFCMCPSGYSALNGVCRNSNNGNGQCNNNQVLIGNQCYNTVSLNSPCIFTQQCQGNGTCMNGICNCPSGTTNYGDGICRGSSSSGDICAAGETPQYSNNQLINCFTTACPSASYCRYNNKYNQYVCCRPGGSTGNTLTCNNPSWTVIYQNNQPLNCMLQSCPTNSICEYNGRSGQYVCCQNSGTSTPSTTCQGNYYTYSNGFPAVCTSDSFCQTSSSTYRYCRLAPGQTFSVCCDRS